MTKTFLSTLAATLVAAPAIAGPTDAVQSFGLSANDAPSIALAWKGINNNITCRAQARAKMFELGARDMSDSTSNSQWGTLGNIKALVWCRDDIAIIAVAGHSYAAASEVRDALYKAF